MVGRDARMRESSATLPISERHVEIDPHQHSFPCDIYISYRLLGHLASFVMPQGACYSRLLHRSTMRLVKPHSLSYHITTLA